MNFCLIRHRSITLDQLFPAGDVSGAGLIDAQRVVQQPPHHRRGAQRMGAGTSVGGSSQGPPITRSSAFTRPSSSAAKRGRARARPQPRRRARAHLCDVHGSCAATALLQAPC